MKCPCCKSENPIYFREHWSKSHIDFACGKCKLEMKIPINSQDHQEVLNKLFDFEYLDPIREKVNNMTYEEKVKRLEELKKRLDKF